MKKKNLAIITTHPIQYQIPLFKKLSSSKICADVFFASKQNLSSKKKDLEFNVNFNWDIELLKGYNYFFSTNQTKEINDWRLSFNNLEKYLKRKKYDAVLIFGWNKLLYWKSFYLAKKMRIPIILRVETNFYSEINLIKKRLKIFILKILFRYINFFLYIGKFNKEFYQFLEVPKQKLFPAFYFVDNNFFFKKKKNTLKNQLNIQNKKICLFAAKFIDRKNPLEFIKLAILLKNYKDIHFLMVGNGILMNQCKDFIQNSDIKNITLLGFKNQKELRDIYHISDLLVLTSRYETWGLVINEALASSVPVIASNKCGGAIDLIKNNINGFIYKENNILDLKNKVLKILKNKNNIKKTNIQNIISSYSVDKTINSINKILNKK